MNIDMDPSADPANTATSLGSREACARIEENDTLDADEDATADTLTLDVTATNIPASNPMISFTYVLNYDETQLSVQTADHVFLIAANGLSAFNVSDPVPDNDGNDRWTGTMIDTGLTAPESGSGVLSRLTISSDASAVAGEYSLVLTEAAVIDPLNNARPPNNMVDTNADDIPDTVIESPVTTVAINTPCVSASLTGFASYLADLHSALVRLSRLGR